MTTEYPLTCSDKTHNFRGSFSRHPRMSFELTFELGMLFSFQRPTNFLSSSPAPLFRPRQRRLRILLRFDSPSREFFENFLLTAGTEVPPNPHPPPRPNLTAGRRHCQSTSRPARENRIEFDRRRNRPAAEPGMVRHLAYLHVLPKRRGCALFVHAGRCGAGLVSVMTVTTRCG